MTGGVAGSEVASDSSCSRGTLSEKHAHEYSEKSSAYDQSAVMMDTSDHSNHLMQHSFHALSSTNSQQQDDRSVADAAAQLAGVTRSTSLGDVKSIACKRGSDTSPSEVAVGEPRMPALPRKKKPPETVAESSEESIHGAADIGGYSIKEFMDYTRIKGRQGLIRQYDQIKATPPKGTFSTSK